MTVMALLDQPKDTETRMRIDNRYVRLINRLIYIAIVLCIPVTEDLHPNDFLEIAALLMGLLTTWEYIISTERGNKLVEPKHEQ